MLPAHLVARLSLTLAALASLATTARAGFLPVSQPNAAYLASTTKFGIPSPPNSSVNSLVADGLTISFSGPMTSVQAGPGHFGWANPPFVEDSAPVTLYSQQQSLRVLTFSQPLETFGVEMMPNNSTSFIHPTFTLTAQFFNGGTPLGTISQGLKSPGGARLFAATDTDTPFTSVRLSAASSQALGFLIADVRAEVVTPEPASLGLFAVGLLGVLGHGWRRRQRKQEHDRTDSDE
jgi:hypothetical protein